MDVAVLSLIRAAIERGSVDFSKEKERVGEFRWLLNRLLELRAGTELLVLASVLEQFDLTDMSGEVMSVYRANESVFDSSVVSPRLRDKLAHQLTRDVVYGLDDHTPPESTTECLSDVKKKLGRMLLLRQKIRGTTSAIESRLSPLSADDKSPVGHYLSARRSLSPPPVRPKPSQEPVESRGSPPASLTVAEAVKGYVVVASYKHVPGSLGEWEQQASADLDNLLGD